MVNRTFKIVNGSSENAAVVFRLQLISGELRLQARIEDGDFWWNVITIDSRGLRQCSGIADNLGFQVEDGKIKVTT